MDVVSRKIIVTRNATIRDTFSVRVNKLRGNREVFTWILAVPGLIRAISPDGGIQVCVCVLPVPAIIAISRSNRACSSDIRKNST